jgi:hypothetical protein
MQARFTLLSAAFLAAIACPAAAGAQTGMTYRFQADTLKGTAWVLGDNARRELESGEKGLAAGRVEIWRDGGKRIFILNPAEKTYYEKNAYLAKYKVSAATVDALTVRSPFRVDGVRHLRIELKTQPRTEAVFGMSCRRSLLTFSYDLELSIEGVPGTVPGRVEGTQDFCVTEQDAAPPMPFGQQIDFKSGHAAIDTGITERLASVKGVPLARMLKVTRTIEQGERVSSTTAHLLSDVRDADVPASLFEIPAGYRLQEPVVTPPSR